MTSVRIAPIEENASGCLVENSCEKVVRARRKPDADERQQIRGGDYAAFLLRARPMLDQRAQGNGK